LFEELPLLGDSDELLEEPDVVEVTRLDETYLYEGKSSSYQLSEFGKL
jgi:hypothetical protein